MTDPMSTKEQYDALRAAFDDHYRDPFTKAFVGEKVSGLLTAKPGPAEYAAAASYLTSFMLGDEPVRREETT